MFLVNCRWQQEEIIKGIEDIEVNDIKLFKHVKTDGIRMFFDYKITDEVRKSINIDKCSYVDEYFLIMGAMMKIPRIDTFAFSVLPVINGSVVEGYKYTVCGASEEIEK